MSTDRVLILYDNRSARSDLQPGWGFSALVERGAVRLLFDSGGDKIVLESNATALGIDLKSADFLFFSHEHCDHVGAASSALHKDLTVVYPESFSQAFNGKVRAADAKSIRVTRSVEFSPGFLSTGELGTTIKEQSLIVSTESGPALITGCAHPGIVQIARSATELAGEPLHLVLGGFHLGGTSPDKVRKIGKALKDLGVERIGPCHCTGEQAIAILREMFGKDGLEVMTGTQIEL
ncbi:MAG: MBL fold metallo-hydrolase [Candidatus Bipolaricaulota bacterium]|nr:MBL fold metallo-hydrolase [Candidatus Bipolaricaulota bacterium]